MTPIPKPARPVKDPRLLREAHAAYTATGCANCGARPIEVHHILPRGRGGGDSWDNLVGLCGEMYGCRAHYFVTRGKYRIVHADGALWLTTHGADPKRLEQIGV